MLKRILITILCLVLLIFCLFIWLVSSLNNREKYRVKKGELIQFEKDMVSGLNLKLVNHSPDYKYSRLEIYHDTIVGFYSNIIDDEYYKYFFIQSTNNPKDIVKFNTYKMRYPSIPHIDDYRNGCLYFGAFGLSYMQSLCSDGTLSDHFLKYNDTLFYANKVMLYKNRAVVTSMNGLFLFDINTQKMLWKYEFSYSPMEGFSSIIGDKLIFTESKSGAVTSYTEVRCLDLNSLKYNWEKVIANDADALYHQQYIARLTLFKDKNNIIIPQVNACYAIEIRTGKTTSMVPWKGFFQNFAHEPKFNVENDTLYTINYKSNIVMSISMVTNEVNWQLKNAFYLGLYKSFVVACTADLRFYMIIDKKTGQILHKIKKYKSKRMDFEFIDKYILINGVTIYK